MARKVSMLLFLLIVTGYSANSQALFVLIFGDKMKTDFLNSGINISLATTGLNSLPGSTLKLDWALGAYTEFKISDHWAVQPQLTVKTPMGAWTDPENLDTTGLNIEGFNSTKASRVLSYVTLPIFMKYNTRIVGFGLGPQVGFMVKGRDKFDGETPSGQAVGITKNIKNEVSRWDFGAAILVEFILRPKTRSKSLRLGLQGYYGFVDINTNPVLGSMTNYSILFNVMIPIGG